tara:strand:+ start:49 stop:282 length:234 start_codon:yes stop_codon:yes gene_type:complete
MAKKRKIVSKRSKSRRGEYEVFRDGKKIGEIFRGESDEGGTRGWIGTTTLPEVSWSGTSVGAPTKWRVIDWFYEFFR